MALKAQNNDGDYRELMEADLIWTEINSIKKAIMEGKKGQEWNKSSSGDLPEKEVAEVITHKLSDVLKFGMEELNKKEKN